MKKILIGLTLFISFSFSETLSLKSGWNLVGINDPLTLDELKTQLGADNLLVVQGPVKTYQKKYVDDNTAFLNDFDAFSLGKGYWVKLLTNATLKYTEPVNRMNSYEMSLKEGWNLINSPVELSLSELINQIGENNLLVVQGAKNTYQRIYVQSGNEKLNDLNRLSLNGGYWIKVASSTNLEFVFNMNKLALDNSGQKLISSMEFNKSRYSVRVYTNVEPTDVKSPSTIAISGVINGINTLGAFKLNSTYPLKSHFIVKVFNGQNEELGKSNNIKYLTSPIDFGNITFKATAKEEIVEPINTTEYQGINVFSTELTYADYGLESIGNQEFNALSIENKRLVVSKLFSVLFYGLPKVEVESLIDSGKLISTIQTKLATANTDLKSVESYIQEKNYNWSESNANREKILARLFHLDLGKHYLNRWVAYVLTQNIMFSPANELETVQASDILNVYNRLVRLMDDNYSMQMITYLHVTSDDNWKRFRSPEDNGREMLEIFSLDFNDSHVPKAGITLQNWRLNKRDTELIIGLNQNDVPQELFGTTVTTGFDFYRELVKADNFKKAVVTRLVGRYFPTVTAVKRTEIIASILSSKPSSFQDILLQIIFSKEFLFNTAKVKTVEESTFSIAKSIYFFDENNFFSNMRTKMDSMHQSPLSYKLGRKNIIPVDTLSFAYYYNFLRRYVMNDVKSDNFNDWDGGWKTEFISKEIANTSTINGLINHIFLSVIARKATNEELIMLGTYAAETARGTYDDMGTYNDRQGLTQIVMEYLSRLTETYTLQKIEE